MTALIIIGAFAALIILPLIVVGIGILGTLFRFAAEQERNE